MTEQKVHKCPECGAECRCERGNFNPKDCVHYKCFTGIAEPDLEQKELPCWISVEDCLPPQTGKVLVWWMATKESRAFAGFVDFSSVIMSLDYCKNAGISHWMPIDAPSDSNTRAQPAENERVKAETIAEAVAEELDRLFQVEGRTLLTKRHSEAILATVRGLLPVQPAQDSMYEALRTISLGKHYPSCPIAQKTGKDYDDCNCMIGVAYKAMVAAVQPAQQERKREIFDAGFSQSAASTPTERPYCQYCHGKGFITGLEHACPYCNPGGEFRAASTPRR